MSTIIITHHYADLDALACVVAASLLYEGSVRVRGRSVSPPVHQYLALHKDHFGYVWHHDLDPEAVDHVVVVDVRDRRRLEEYEAILARGPKVTVFDHHPACPFDLEADELVLEPTGACATLLVERLKAAGKRLSAEEATLLMLGIYSDTGSLSFDSTTPRDIEAAAWLLRQGANLRMVNRYLQEQYSPEQRQLLVGMMGEVSEVSVNAVEIATAVGHAPRFVRGASAVVSRIMQLGGHDAVFGVIEFTKDKRVQVIGRSRVPYVDMGQLLSTFGGGGHPGAAAATFKRVPLEDVLAQLGALLDEVELAPACVRDVMTSPVETVRDDASLEEVALTLDRLKIRGAPVVGAQGLCGVISTRDLSKAQRQDGWEGWPVTSVMTHRLVSIAPEEPIEDALGIMTEHDIGRLPVVDTEGHLVGILSRADLIRRFYT